MPSSAAKSELLQINFLTFKETFLLFISVKDFINPENYFL